MSEMMKDEKLRRMTMAAGSIVNKATEAASDSYALSVLAHEDPDVPKEVERRLRKGWGCLAKAARHAEVAMLLIDREVRKVKAAGVLRGERPASDAADL